MIDSALTMAEVAYFQVVQGELARISFEGTLDSSTVVSVRGKLDSLLSGGVRWVLLDLAKVEYVSSAGWGLIMRFAELAEKRAGRIVLHGLIPKIQSTYRMLQLTDVVPAVASEADGLALLEGVKTRT